ncbi:MAG: hypothetical protein MUP82_08650 [Candidatus Marinimicrobia bacterium]|nr:hypothetical protein [Candidatus Neomarinimicrobiota bacterium]
MIKFKYLLSLFILLGSLYSQTKTNNHIKKEIDLSEIFAGNKFHPTNFCVSPTGIYFLDSATRQVAFLSNDGAVGFAGGYGTDNDAFIDPIEILSSKLKIWIVDRTENKLIEFDHKLNYIRSVDFDRIYPEFSGIDDWGNVLLLSKQEQMILKATPPIENFDDFIDLSMWTDINSCISDVHVAFDGTIGILANCNDSVYLFNRLGKLENVFHLKTNDSKYFIKISNDWLVINAEGQIKSIRGDKKIDLSLEQPLLDVAQMDSKLYLLFYNKIWVVDVSME